MPVLKFFAKDVQAVGSNHGSLTEVDPGSTFQSFPDGSGWSGTTQVGTNVGYSLFVWDGNAAAFGGTALPNAVPNNSDCLRTIAEPACSGAGGRYTGTFDAGTWSIVMSWSASIQSGATVVFQIRLWRSSDPTGQTNVTEITSGAIASSQITSVNSNQNNSTASFTPGKVTLNGEYLFLQFACQSIGPGVANADCTMDRGGGASAITIQTPNFTPSPGTVTHYIGGDAVVVSSAVSARTWQVNDTGSLGEAQNFDSVPTACVQPVDTVPLSVVDQSFASVPAAWAITLWGLDYYALNGTAYSQNPADSIAAPTDSVGRSEVLARAPSENVAIPTDAPTRAAVYARSIGDNVAIPTDTAAGSKTIPRSVNESVAAPTDAVARVVAYARTVADSVTAPTDAIARATVYLRGVAESITKPTDSPSRSVGYLRALAEAVSAPSDSAARAIALARGIAESVPAPADAVTRAIAAARSIADSVAKPSDAPTHAAQFARAVAENVTAAVDSVARAAAFACGIAEAIPIPTDSVVGTQGHSGTAYSRSVTESTTAPADAIARVTSYARTIYETIAAVFDVVSSARPSYAPRQTAVGRAPGPLSITGEAPASASPAHAQAFGQAAVAGSHLSSSLNAMGAAPGGSRVVGKG